MVFKFLGLFLICAVLWISCVHNHPDDKIDIWAIKHEIYGALRKEPSFHSAQISHRFHFLCMRAHFNSKILMILLQLRLLHQKICALPMHSFRTFNSSPHWRGREMSATMMQWFWSPTTNRKATVDFRHKHICVVIWHEEKHAKLFAFLRFFVFCFFTHFVKGKKSSQAFLATTHFYTIVYISIYDISNLQSGQR